MMWWSTHTLNRLKDSRDAFWGWIQRCVSEDNEITNNFCLMKIQITLKASSDAMKLTKDSSHVETHLTGRLFSLLSLLAFPFFLIRVFLLVEIHEKEKSKCKQSFWVSCCSSFSYFFHDFYLKLINFRFCCKEKEKLKWEICEQVIKNVERERWQFKFNLNLETLKFMLHCWLQ